MNLILIKKAFATIEFDMYALYRFVEAYSHINRESMFKIRKNGIFIEETDPSRIVLISIILNNNSYKFLRDGEVTLNLDDLEALLKCQSKDKTGVRFPFGEKCLYLDLYSKKFCSSINRSLLALDSKIEETHFEELKNLGYAGIFSLNKTQLNYILRNLGLYSEVVTLVQNPQEVIFKEIGSIGEQNINFSKERLKICTIDFSSVQESLEEESNKTYKNIIDTKTLSGTYSLSFFNIIGKIASILTNKDQISFELFTDFPLHALMQLSELGDSQVNYYIAPRTEEAEFDEDEDEF
ncbi:MAG: hypothetical protein GF311_19525 [Candidatus Lokiarchaeota archaeon]|nr:hypothetical protein [Candidatus Lokiarchaeota archaeon]